MLLCIGFVFWVDGWRSFVPVKGCRASQRTEQQALSPLSPRYRSAFGLMLVDVLVPWEICLWQKSLGASTSAAMPATAEATLIRIYSYFLCQ